MMVTPAMEFVRKLALAVVLPLAISGLTIFVVRSLLQIGFISDDGSGVMTRVAAVIVDMSTQAAYFTVLMAVTRDFRYIFVLLSYQIISAFMFLGYGSPTLLATALGTIDIVWHELWFRLGFL